MALPFVWMYRVQPRLLSAWKRCGRYSSAARNLNCATSAGASAGW